MKASSPPADPLLDAGELTDATHRLRPEVAIDWLRDPRGDIISVQP